PVATRPTGQPTGVPPSGVHAVLAVTPSQMSLVQLQSPPEVCTDDPSAGVDDSGESMMTPSAPLIETIRRTSPLLNRIVDGVTMDAVEPTVIDVPAAAVKVVVSGLTGATS